MSQDSKNSQVFDLGMGMTVQRVFVTPTIAADWLSRNHDENRIIRRPKVISAMEDMRGGRWKFTHQGICFDGSDVLLDGQHRLSAIVESGWAVWMLVFRSQTCEITDPIDRNAPRTIGFITGLDNRTAAACRVLLGFETGHEHQSDVTPGEVENVFERHQKCIENIAGRNQLQGGLLAAAAWAMPVDSVGVLAFLQQVSTGEMLRGGDPAFAYRSWRERNKRIGTWAGALAALNCIRFHICKVQMGSVYIGDMGFKAITSQRRKLGVENTPGTDLVGSVSFMPSRGER